MTSTMTGKGSLRTAGLTVLATGTRLWCAGVVALAAPLGTAAAQGFQLGQTLPGSLPDTLAVETADVDGDGDQDIIASGSWTIVWYENLNALGNYGNPRPISTALWTPQVLLATDFDGDLDLDLVVASHQDDVIAWFENSNGAGAFGPAQILVSNVDGISDIALADVDGDGDRDLFAAVEYDGSFAWFEDLGGGSYGLPHLVHYAGSYRPRAVALADLDGDGDLDFLTGTERENVVAWHANTDGLGAAGPRRIIADQAWSVQSIRTADLDGDGLRDVLWGASGNWAGTYGKVAWNRSLDGLGAFGADQVLVEKTGGATEVVAADIDNDGDLDVVAACAGNLFLDFRNVGWFENLGGSGGFSAERIITEDLLGSSMVDAADFDGDGDLDVVSAAMPGNAIAWFEHGPYPAAAWQWYCGTGTNLDAYSVITGFELGGTFQGAVNVPAPHTWCAIGGYLRRQTFSLWGQEVLVDLAAPEILGLPWGPGSPNLISWIVPSEPGYAGYHVFTQAAYFGGGSIGLTCAFDCTAGF